MNCVVFKRGEWQEDCSEWVQRHHCLPPVSPHGGRRRAVLDLLFEDVWQEVVDWMKELLQSYWEYCSCEALMWHFRALLKLMSYWTGCNFTHFWLKFSCQMMKPSVEVWAVCSQIPRMLHCCCPRYPQCCPNWVKTGCLPFQLVHSTRSVVSGRTWRTTRRINELYKMFLILLKHILLFVLYVLP